jgi:uncharacterized membrane protein
MIISNNMYSYILILLVVLSFTLNPYFKKSASKNVSSTEFLIVYHFIASAIILVYIGYQIYTKKCSIYCFKKLNKTDYFWTIMACLTGVSGALILMHLIKIEDVSFIIPNIQGIVIALSTLIGVCIFNESMDKLKICGILLVIMGVFVINYSRIKVKNI